MIRLLLKMHWRLAIVLLIYLLLSTTHSLVVPLTVGNDEWAHFLYVRFISENSRLPMNLAERDWNESGYKSDDPPLYHLLTAAATGSIDPTRLLRPTNSPQRELADSVVYPYEFILHTGPEIFPYRGEVLLWHVVRGVSIIFGMVVILLTYITGLALFPGRRYRALLAAGFLAFLPGFMFHSSMVSYESFGAALTALFLLVAIKAIMHPQQWRWWPLLGILAGLAITTKYSSVLLPVEIIFVAWLADWQSKSKENLTGRWKMVLARLGVAGLTILLVVSWWFGFVAWNFNTVEDKGWVVGILEPLMVRGGADSAAISITSKLFGETNVSVDAPIQMMTRNYPELMRITIDSFWAGLINGRYIFSPWLALLFTTVALLGIVGLWWVWKRAQKMERIWLVLLLFHTLLIVPLLAVRLIYSSNPLEVSQGRHLLMPATSAIAILLVWGWKQWHRKLSQVVVAALLVWSVWGQIGGAILFQPTPMPVWANESFKFDTQAINKEIVDGLQLVGVDPQLSDSSHHLEVTLWWQALAPITTDYLIELQLLDQNDQLASYSVSHPVQGRYPTRAWELDDVVKDVHWLPLVDVAPGAYQLQMQFVDRGGQPVSESSRIALGNVDIDLAEIELDPCVVWFQGQPRQRHLLVPPYYQDSTFVVISPEPPILKSLSGQDVQAPFVSNQNIHTFMVGPTWESTYQLIAGDEVCQYLTFDLPPRHYELPEITGPLDINFNDEVKLIGYDLPTRHIQPGGRLPLTLYWQALDYMGQDYQIFDNLLDSQQNRWGGYDRRARDGYSTLLWTPGEIITDTFGVPVDPLAPDGVYTLDVGLYTQTENGAVSLPVMADGQASEQSSVRLGPIKVGGPPPHVISTDPAPQVTLNQSLNHQLSLVGYDLANENGSSLQLTLYWQVDDVLPVDYTTFVHLRDQDNQNVAQVDGPPAQGQYPTTLWEPGEVVIDEIVLPLPDDTPAGRYTLVVGLYDFITGQRLPVAGYPANEINLEQIELP